MNAAMPAQVKRLNAAVPAQVKRLNEAVPAQIRRLNLAQITRLHTSRGESFLLPAAGNDRMRRGLATAAVLAVAAFGITTTVAGNGPGSGSAVSLTAEADGGVSRTDGGSVASRGRGRDHAAAPSANAKQNQTNSKQTDPAQAASKAPATADPTPTRPAPVGGLTQAEMDNAVAIVDVAKRENLPKRAAIVALATALQESHLRNLANPNLPSSLDHPNQGVGYDYDSVGLFQQRPNWGSIDQLMDPHESARRFYAALVRIPGWGDYAITVAAQMVQRSAFPDAYAKWEGLATQIADTTMQ
ncbi:hypothetical protein [Dactylosporangium darangshiense]